MSSVLYRNDKCLSLTDYAHIHSLPVSLPHTHTHTHTHTHLHTHHRLEITVLLKNNCDKHANQSRLDEKPQLGGKSQKVKSELAQVFTFNFAHLQMSGFRITGEYTVCIASGLLTSLRPYTDHTHTVTREFPLNCRCTLQSKHQCLSYMMFTTTKTSKTRSTKGCHLSEACREDKSLHLISLTTTRSMKPAQINNFRTVSQWLYFLPSVFQHQTQRMLEQLLLYKCLDCVFRSKIKAQ